ncbi:hypothetical protein BGZ95_002692 [Linnemannia exigua]|uniref:Uncharacterized protein n=1 Tax=Linnemannia exigua TaxID=604196 RepID=A0AAD4H2S6_9FUNG|nr:hypothetical protein BGZ95_002692 [Linnemannia exigua]
MDYNDQHSNNNNNDMTELPSIQERRRQLEAYQAERALNKSLLRASVGPVDHSSRSSHPLNQSVAGYRSRKSMSVKDVLHSKEAMRDSGANEHGQQPPSSTKSIIQLYNALSKTSKPVSTPLGVRRHGIVAHKIEKKPPPTRPGTSSIHNSNLEANNNDSAEMVSIRQDRTTTVSSTKKQEDIYLSQARLMQWYLMNKRAGEHFSAQEKSAETQFELVGKSLLEKQVNLQNLQKRFEVEQDLVELESTLGYQRDQLLSIIDGLDAFKADYEEFTAALDREARVLSIPGIDDSNLSQWLGQIRDCQSVLDMSSRQSSKDYEFIQAIAQVMQELCNIVKEEIQEMRQCTALAAKLREVETTEASLLATSLDY